MKKILVILCLCLISVFSLVGCKDYNIVNDSNYEDKFMIIYLEYEDKIYVHKDTKVMYLFVKSGYGAGLSVMLDQDGKPLLWQGE